MQMVENIWENGKMINVMEKVLAKKQNYKMYFYNKKELYILQMAIDMKVNGKMISDMEKVY